MLSAPVIAGPGSAPIGASGATLVVHEWTDSGPSYLHIHRSDDEIWHVLEGSLRFRFASHDHGLETIALGRGLLGRAALGTGLKLPRPLLRRLRRS